MQELPFEIPQSLNSYLTQFQNDPDKGIANLKAFLKKRGMDAVGYFLLSWLCLNDGRKEEALQHALRAKSYAPGSPFFQHLHYFLVHPDHFEAWKPFAPDEELESDSETAAEQELESSSTAGQEGETAQEPGTVNSADEQADPEVSGPETGTPASVSAETDENAEADPSLNLDNLIEQLSDAEKKKITISTESEDDRNLGEYSEKVSDIASETLAKIYEKQKKYSDALRTLNKLSSTRPDKADHYRQEIERIRTLMNREELEDGEE